MARETINGISVPIPGTGEPADFVGDLRQIATDLSASYAARSTSSLYTRRPVPTAVLSDSIGIYNGNGGDQQGDSYIAHLFARSQQRIRFAATYGTGGFSVEQIETTHLPTALANPRLVGGQVIISGGTNNMNNDAQVTSGLAALTRICDALEAAGINPVLITIPPRGDAANSRVPTWNAAVRALARSRSYLLLDVHRAAADPATHLYRTGYTIDGIHPSRTGARAIAELLAPTLFEAVPAAPRVLADPSVPIGNVQPNSLFPTSGGSITGQGAGQPNVPLGWDLLTNGANPAATLTDDGEGGRYWNVPVTDTNVLLQYNGTPATVVPGQRYAFAIAFKATGYEATTNEDSGPSFNISMEFLGGTAGGVTPVSGWRRGHGNAECVAYFEAVAPTGSNRARINIVSDQAAGASISVRRPTVTDLTLLGLA